MRKLLPALVLFMAAGLHAREDSNPKPFVLRQAPQPEIDATNIRTPEEMRRAKLAALRKSVADAQSNLDGAKGAEAPPDRIAMLENILKSAKASLDRYQAPAPKVEQTPFIPIDKPQLPAANEKLPFAVDGDERFCCRLFELGKIDFEGYKELAEIFYEEPITDKQREQIETNNRNVRNYHRSMDDARSVAYMRSGYTEVPMKNRAEMPKPVSEKQRDIIELATIRASMVSHYIAFKSAKQLYEDTAETRSKTYARPDAPTPEEWAMIKELRAKKESAAPTPDLSTPFGK